MNATYVIGLDFGTDSVRAIIVQTNNGAEIANETYYYKRWKAKKYCDPTQNVYRQHPLDYIEGTEAVIKACLAKVNPSIVQNIVAIGIDATASTPVAVDTKGTPLALLPYFQENPDAMFILWKDHSAIKEAEEINEHAKKFKPDYLKYVGGIYSAEWYWAKALHTLRKNKSIYKAHHTWVEQSDWIPYMLCGHADINHLKRNRCAAGHKALWSASFKGFPPESFWTSLDPLLDKTSKSLPDHTYTSDHAAGNLSKTWAKKLGLSQDVIVATGIIDAHAGAIGAQIQPFDLCKITGTSTCDILVIPKNVIGKKTIAGICGQVDGSVVPEMIGLEAGQSAFGDIYTWFQQLLNWPLNNLPGNFVSKENLEKIKQEINNNFFNMLEKESASITFDSDTALSVDWFNGRRSPYANQKLKGAILNLDLSSDAATLYKSLVESTCFGAKSINECLVQQEIPIKQIIAVGGIAKKSPFVMQMLADVLEMPIKTHRSEQTCAMGSAMIASVAAGVHKNLSSAMKAMGTGFEKTYYPIKKNREVYRNRYSQYMNLGKMIEKNQA